MFRCSQRGRSRCTEISNLYGEEFFPSFNHCENMTISALSSAFWIQIADLKQLPGIQKTKRVMYIITSKSTFGTIGEAMGIKMTSKVVGKNLSFRFSLVRISTRGLVRSWSKRSPKNIAPLKISSRLAAPESPRRRQNKSCVVCLREPNNREDQLWQFKRLTMVVITGASHLNESKETYGQTHGLSNLEMKHVGELGVIGVL